MEGIYKITNKLNNKSYIGQSVHCGKRLDEHCKGCQFIDDIIQLEGIKNFTFEILKQVDKEDMSKWEDYYIEKYKTMFPNGYNKRWNTKEDEREALIKLLKEKEKTNDIYKIDSNILYIPYNIQGKITLKNFLVYYYLLSISKQEKVNGLLKHKININSINISSISKILNISRVTFYDAVKNLKINNIISENNNIYTIAVSPPHLACVELNVLKRLLQEQKNYGTDLIRVYAYLNSNNMDDYNITVTKIMEELGHNKHDNKYHIKINNCLSFLSKNNFISKF